MSVGQCLSVASKISCEDRSCSVRLMLADRQTDRQTNKQTHHITLHLSRGEQSQMSCYIPRLVVVAWRYSATHVQLQPPCHVYLTNTHTHTKAFNDHFSVFRSINRSINHFKLSLESGTISRLHSVNRIAVSVTLTPIFLRSSYIPFLFHFMFSPSHSHNNIHLTPNYTSVYANTDGTVVSLISIDLHSSTGPDLRGRGQKAQGPGLPPTGGLPPNPSYFFRS